MNIRQPREASKNDECSQERLAFAQQELENADDEGEKATFKHDIEAETSFKTTDAEYWNKVRPRQST